MEQPMLHQVGVLVFTRQTTEELLQPAAKTRLNVIIPSHSSSSHNHNKQSQH